MMNRWYQISNVLMRNQILIIGPEFYKLPLT